MSSTEPAWEESPGRLRCPCGFYYEPFQEDPYYAVCPNCKSEAMEIVR